MAGRADLRDLLHESERVERDVDLAPGPDRVVVTQQRVLAFTPDGPGANFRHVDRPNAESVELRWERDRTAALRTAVFLVAAVVVVVAGAVVVETDGLIPSLDVGPGASAVGVAGLIDDVRYVVGLIDDGIVAVGLLLLLPAAYYGYRYVRSRRRLLAVEVAGDDDLTFDATRIDDAEHAVADLRRALGLPAAER